VRDLPKLLLATLTTLTITFAGPVAQAPAAVHRGSSGHHERGSRHARQHAARDQPRANRRAAHRQARANHQAANHPAHANRQAGPEQRRQNLKTASAAPSGAAVIAAVLATPCQDTGLAPSAENIARVRASVLCLINKVRAEHSLQPLVINAQLEAAAEGHASELVADDYFAHVSPSGETPVDRIKATGYINDPSEGYVIGENLAWGTYSLSTPQAIVEAWVASPGHLANILESRYTETGIGVTAAVPESLGEGNPGGTYAEEFGVIVH
jgi:uncharacterized protein YkwD